MNIKKSFFYRAVRKIIKSVFPPKELTYQDIIKKNIKNYASDVYFAQEGNDKLFELLSSGKPVFITRFGSVELNTINEYLKAKKHEEKAFNKNKTLNFYSENTFSSMHKNAGFFPVTKENLDSFAQLYLDSIKNIDCCGVWFNDGEASVLRNGAGSALLVELGCLNSWLYEKPYTSILRGKKVLVIHPFENTILSQIKNREKLFENQDVLPPCDFSIIKAPQTIAGNTDGYSSWFEALETTKKKIDEADFDIALLGCGAYGLPLGAYIKSKGKTAIHIGGALQLLFGIKGNRWIVNDDPVTKLFNEYWTYPLDSDTPPNSNLVENNTYWK